MEVFRCDLHYIFVKDRLSLWWNRITGEFFVRSAWDFSDIEDIECLGVTDGIIGKVEHSNIYEPRLMIINESVPVGQLYSNHTIYKIKSICFLNSGMKNTDPHLCECTKHGSQSHNLNPKNSKKTGTRIFDNAAFLKTVGAVKTVGNTIKSTTQQAATQLVMKQTTKNQQDLKVAERLEKRLTDELHKIFDDSDSFYYSRTLDLTNTLERQYHIEQNLIKTENVKKSATDVSRWWKYVDDRFFWNKHMLKDIISLGSPNCDPWILPIIQGYVSLTQIPVEPTEPIHLRSSGCYMKLDTMKPISDCDNPLGTTNICDDAFTLGLISRRSRYQAGTRYNRRGVEPSGKVANYVETEQIVSIECPNSTSVHRVSFVQVRGSVPIFWSQPELKFRPPPQLDRTEEESYEAFKKHFEDELHLYKQVCIVNLVEQQGRERLIWEAYSDHVLKYNNPDIIYATFDFHEYCRGMRYENVSILINALTDVISEMRFCWRDDQGLICTQRSVFRVNCIDCLDRTNVVQTAIAKYVLETQLCRLGLGTPDAGLSPSLRAAFLTMWADNGDMISRQYAGTKALKGDYTRTGERKFTGMMKDGVASANRYYLSTFKDALRQVAIDLMTGESRAIPEQLIDSEALANFNMPCTSVKNQTIPDTTAMAQHVKSLIDDCKKLLVDTEPVLGSWGLIDADPHTGDPQETEMDSVLLLTSEAYHVADYDETSDRVLAVQEVSLRDITSVELGTIDNGNTTIFNMARRSNNEPVHCIRINYTHNNESGYFHMFRSTSLRFFNNMAVVIKTKDEMVESLHSICESIMVARDVAKLQPIPFLEGVKLEKKKSKVLPSQAQSGPRSSLYLDLSRLPTITRNVSETQLVADIRSVGSKALNNMTEQFSKLNKLSHSLNARARPTLQLKFDQSASKTKKIFTLGQKSEKKKGSFSDGLSSDYSSDDENRTNIFEPTLDNFENSQHYIGKSVVQKTENENDCDLIQNPLYQSKIEPSENQNQETFTLTGIVPTEKSTMKTPSNIPKKNPFDLDSEPSSIQSRTPEIQIQTDGSFTKPIPPSSLVLCQKLSHSSNDINFEDNQKTTSGNVNFHVRSNSQHEITLNIAQSHSESALKQLKNITSPMSSTTREMVLSPFSKLAKGVQTLGANLDPRKMKGPSTVKHITEQQYEEHKRLQEKWRDCNTRLVAL